VDVILLQDVDKLGLRGDVVSVARGYARNYLLPRRLAEEASPGRVAELQKREERLARQQAESFEQAQQIADRLAGAELRFDVKAGPTGSLFGSVTATDVADALWNTHKVRVDRRKVDLHEPIKRIGRYTVPIELFTDVTVELRTLVVPEGGELPPEEELQALEAAEQAAEQAEAEAAEAAHAEAEAALATELEEAEPEEAEEAAAETPSESPAVAERAEG
jgi:large subunit ribosomal protein L9